MGIQQSHFVPSHTHWSKLKRQLQISCTVSLTLFTTVHASAAYFRSSACLCRWYRFGYNFAVLVSSTPPPLQQPFPVFRYLGHLIAHLAHASLARSQIVAEVKSDLNRYKQLPLNAFERVQLVNSVLMTRWLYHSMFVPHGRMFQKVDQRVKDFVTMAKGIGPKYNTYHVVAAHKKGGPGLHQMFWAYRAKYITAMRCTLRDPDHPITKVAQNPVHHTMAPLRDYSHIVEHMGGTVPLEMQRR